MIHSLPASPVPAPCETVVRRPHPRLRGHVLAYSGFRTTEPIGHRVLPINVPALIIDITGAGRVVTGASSRPVISAADRWGHGVTVGLTPDGVRALLGVPMRELTERSVPLGELIGGRDAELAERLAAIPDWAGRFALLDGWLAARLRPGREDPLVTAAWKRLQQGPRVAAVAAELGVGRRRLETGFQRRIGLSPGRVARIARFQRAVDLVALGRSLPAAAADAGYADQPHFTREVRVMAGVAPTELRALLQDATAVPR
ncbi:helix-turn-helix domain-containing protein [Actinoplanes sp. NPDC024001]|uniref:helix-turn-helix domain-containing protein n=1 Tax=Actinoplanes sp. NPDC024001 TaxID=3154598 RepID=UPI0033FF4117